MSVDTALIIDDEIELCILVESFLTKKNTRTTFSTNLKDGVEKFKQIKPNLLILDHNLPDGYGIENISIFKKLNSSLQVIIISAMSHLRDEALSKGADYFLEKPISFSALNKILAKN